MEEVGPTTPFSVQIDHIGTTDIVTVRGEIDMSPPPSSKMSYRRSDRASLSTSDISTSWIPQGSPSCYAAGKHWRAHPSCVSS